MPDHPGLSEHLDPVPERSARRARRIAQVEIFLGEHVERPGGERCRRLVAGMADVGGQHQNRHRPGAHDLTDRLDPVHAGQLDIHGHQVRLNARQCGDRLLRGAADR
jgi:hypothetical protein